MNIDNFVISSSQSSNAAASSDTNNSGKRARAIPSDEFPTQLLTSSDDILVKFWDVRNSIGSVSPIECSATVCPFSADIQNVNPSDVTECRRQWKRGRKLPGTVTHLATLNTGHSCNGRKGLALFSFSKISFEPKECKWNGVVDFEVGETNRI